MDLEYDILNDFWLCTYEHLMSKKTEFNLEYIKLFKM